jgi:hypothetical protein
MLSFSVVRHAAVALIALSAAASQAAAPSHLYNLNGSLTDAMGGPSLVASGGTLSATGYTFAANAGLSLSNALPSDTYTIDTTFTFDETSGWRKMVDFKDLTSDSGLYNLSTQLNFFSGLGSGPTGVINSGSPVRVTLSRDGSTDTVNGYLNGTLQFSFNDTSGWAKFNAGSNIGHFFIDDFPTGQHEATSGFVDYIAVYNTALSANDIATLTPTAGVVPEPSQLALVLGGLGVVGWSLRRKA